MTPVQEQYAPHAMAANGSLVLPAGTANCGFLCTVAGTLNVSDAGGATYIPTMAVVVGQFYPFPATASSLLTVQLAGGAAGTWFSC